MAEIEDMGAGREALEDAVDLRVEPRAAGDQRQRIEIALQREPLGQGGDGGPRLDRRVEADRVDVGERRRISPVASPRRAERR